MDNDKLAIYNINMHSQNRFNLDVKYLCLIEKRERERNIHLNKHNGRAAKRERERHILTEDNLALSRSSNVGDV